ncbi:MAG: hypothetical protein KC550_03760 [Nanoarchaeota archaeon]|nr:hypothetical protein [Nanoarchaeota archaeon]
MAGRIEIIGNEASVIYYNLNKQFSNLSKIIITKEILINSFEGEGVRTLFNDLSASTRDSYMDILVKEKSEGAFDGPVNTDLYKQIQESLPKISQNMMEIQLKDYNFMSSISNARFNVVLRCDNFSITKYYEEKGQIMSSIKNLIKEYLEFEGNIYRISRLENFQIEIYESEEMYKYVNLKKEGNSITLASNYSFPRASPFDFGLGQEFYFSVGEDFHFYKNNQETAIIREQNKLVEKDINKQEKILSNEELMLINNNTKNINDALIEMYINPKGALRIINVSIVENNIFPKASDDGFVLNKSSRNYDRVSLLTLRDNIDDDFPNPKYLIIRNEGEVKEFLLDLGKLRYIDGLIFTTNFYAAVLDKIGKNMDLDIIYYNKILHKSLDVRIDFENLSIDGALESSRSSSNPFSSIIDNKNKDRDEYLERLKNVDLSTPAQSSSSRYGGIDDIDNLTKSIISSPESSMKRSSSSSSGGSGRGSGGGMYGGAVSGGKMSAISMLAASALNKPEKKKEVVEEVESIMPSSNYSDSSSSFSSSTSRSSSPLPSSKSNSSFNNSMNQKNSFDDLAMDEIRSQKASSMLDFPSGNDISMNKKNYNNNDFANLDSRNNDYNNSSSSINSGFDSYSNTNARQSQSNNMNRDYNNGNDYSDRNNFKGNNSTYSNSRNSSNSISSFEEESSQNPFDDMFETEKSSSSQNNGVSSFPDLDLDSDENSNSNSYGGRNAHDKLQYGGQNENFKMNSMSNSNAYNDRDGNDRGRRQEQSYNRNSSFVNSVDDSVDDSEIKILTNPNIRSSDNFFVDASGLSQVSGGSIFLMTTNVDDLNNPNLNYVVPISLINRNNIKGNVSLLINSTNEYFLIDRKLSASYFINLTFIDSSIKKRFLEDAVNKLGNLNLMILKDDINLLKNCVSLINSVYIKDLNSNSEYEIIRDKILSFGNDF